MIELKDVGKTFVMKKGGGSFKRKIVRAVQGVDLDWKPGDFIAIVGESGCGKSTLGRMIAGIITPSDGELRWDGREIRYLQGEARRAWSRTAQLIPQDPYAALNPVRKIRSSFADPLLYHHMVPRARVEDRMAELLRLVGLEPDNVIDKYPHELSGGQRQRVVVARALTVEPGYLIADEAVSMVDVSLRLGIMNRIKEISQTRDLGLMFITHDFRVARYIAQGGHILVMYLGRVIERGPAEEVLRHPLHPYTQALISAVPILQGSETRLSEVVPKSYELTDQVPETGCAFEPRCPFATAECKRIRPELEPYGEEGHAAACLHAEPRQLVANVASDSA
jgi:peptide/nickel transport system ATP-binding protein